MINHSMTLDYSLAPGWMAPFIEGLKGGQARAKQCAHCHRVSFPPVRTCSCGGLEQDWIELTGTAQLIYQCVGLDGHFAMVRFTGADTLSVVKLKGFEHLAPGNNNQGVLLAARAEMPAMVVGPLP